MVKRKSPKNMTVTELLEKKTQLQAELDEITTIIGQLVSSVNPQPVLNNIGIQSIQPSAMPFNPLQNPMDESFQMPVGRTIDPYSVENDETYKALKAELEETLSNENNE